MFNARIALILAGLAFATWETIDMFWISFPAAAAVFAALFLSGTLWLWAPRQRPRGPGLAAAVRVRGRSRPNVEGDDGDKGCRPHARPHRHRTGHNGGRNTATRETLATRLCVTVSRPRHHLRNVVRKLNVSSRTQLAQRLQG